MIHDKRRFSVVLAALAVSFAPHLLNVPLFVSAFVAGAWGYALGMQYRGWPVPSRWLRGLLALGCLALVVVTYGRPLGQDEGVALLSLMLGLKAVESKSVRDMLAMLFLAYFVIVTNVLYSQTLAMSAYMLFSVMAVTAALIHLHSGEPRLGADVRRGAVMLVQAVPLAVLLFVFFPRLQGTLWGVSDTREDGVSGFSDTVEPGSVAALSLSREIAFRVEFSDVVPDRRDLYWRGAVLDTFDGLQWVRRLPFALAPKYDVEGRSGLVRYALTLEPHNREWVFALDLPLSAPRGTVLRQDMTLASFRSIRSRVRYELISAPVSQPEADPAAVWSRLPEDGNPRARELARQWAASGADARAVVEAALSFFRDGGFVYTLRPGVLSGDVVDQFLFASRRGYCEHYATAMAFLLRAAGIPARVVVGYQGGELNPLGEYFIVRQSDAHAWTEVWLEGRWVRVDPTSVVAAERLSAGAEAVSLQGETVLPPGGARLLRSVGRFFSMSWDAANNSWNQWVLGFSHERQRSLWQRLGLDPATRAGAGKLAAILGLGLAVVLGTVFWFMLRSRKNDRDRAVQLYERFCARMARLGLPRQPAEGPRDFARRVVLERPSLGRRAEEIADAYIALRYRGAGGDMTVLERLVGEFMEIKA